MFNELLRQPGVTEEIELRSTFGFLAYHGGNLERVTDIVAEHAARAGGASCYLVRQPDDLRWHIPSIEVGRDPSPMLASFLEHVDVVVSVHGYGRDAFWTRLLLGGSNRTLAAHLAHPLRAALDEYEVIDDLDAIPEPLRGLHRLNPVNLVSGGGVQLELPPRVRGMGPRWADWPTAEHQAPAAQPSGRRGKTSRPKQHRPSLVPHTEALIGALAEAAGTWSG